MSKNQTSPMNGIKALPAFPVVLVSVADNVMVAAAFHFYSYNPPSVMVGIKPEKYTYDLIKEHKEFCINIPKANQLELVKTCGSQSGRNTDKFSLTGLSKSDGQFISSKMVEECPVNLECKVVHEISLEGSHKWFIGEIKGAHIDSNYSRSDALMFWLGQFRQVGSVIEGLNDDEVIKIDQTEKG